MAMCWRFLPLIAAISAATSFIVPSPLARGPVAKGASEEDKVPQEAPFEEEAQGVPPKGEDGAVILGGNDCVRVPEASYYALDKNWIPSSLQISAGCGSVGGRADDFHAFLVELIPADLGLSPGRERAGEIQVRFAPRTGGRASSEHWLTKKLVVVKSAGVAAIRRLAAGNSGGAGESGWILVYGKQLKNGKSVPTIALLKLDENSRDLQTTIFKFEETDLFFSPVVAIGNLGSGAVLWGEMTGGETAIAFVPVNAAAGQVHPRKIIRQGGVLDSLLAVEEGGLVYVTWVEEVVGLPKREERVKEAREKEWAWDCFQVRASSYNLRGEKIAEAAHQICNEVVLMDLKPRGDEIVVAGLEARRGRWHPFEMRVTCGGAGTVAGSCKASVKRRGSSLPLGAVFAGGAQTLLWKERYDPAGAFLRVEGRDFPAAGEGASEPISLSVCPGGELVAGWIQAPGKGGQVKVKFIEIVLTDEDSDGTPDPFDICPGEGPSGR